MQIRGLKARDPEFKGVIERRNEFFETSFVPGRSFDSRPTSMSSSPTGWSARIGWFQNDVSSIDAALGPPLRSFCLCSPRSVDLGRFSPE
jgi:hypothetical protein